MSRLLASVTTLSALVFSASALAADPMIEMAPPLDDSPARAYATVFAGASLPHAEVTAYQDGIPVGISFDLDFDVGYIVGGAVGTTVLPHLRGEIEFSVVQTTITDFFGIPVELDSTGYNLLGNLWYDVDTGSSFTPYVGGGVGYGHTVVTSDGVDQEMTSSGWLYQLGAGVRVAAADNIALDLGYRYRVQPDATVSGDTLMLPPDVEIKSSATNHIVQAGLSIGF
jgi:opacity protein-like surface antigen